MSVEKKDDRSLSLNQIAAIRYAKELGKEIAREYPEIAEAYEAGFTHEEIAELYDLMDICRTRGMARTSIYNALKILIPDVEKREELAYSHYVDVGNRSVEAGIGVHAFTPEQRHESAVKAGRKVVELQKGVHAATFEQLSEWGSRARDMKVGIHAMTTEERSDKARRQYAEGKGIGSASSEELRAWGGKAKELKAGIHGFDDAKRKEVAKLSMAARGVVPWNNENIDTKSGLGEYDYCAKLINDPKYQRRTIDGKAVIESQLIAGVINDVFYGGEDVRKGSSIENFNRKYGILKLEATNALALRTIEERKEASRLAIIACGKIPWENFRFDSETCLDEHNYCIRLWQDDRFKYSVGSRVCTDIQAIADELNRVFHEGEIVRTKSSVKNFRYQKMKGEL